MSEPETEARRFLTGAAIVFFLLGVTIACVGIWMPIDWRLTYKQWEGVPFAIGLIELVIASLSFLMAYVMWTDERRKP